MMYFLYTLLITLSIPLALGRLYVLGKKNPLYRKRWKERLGFIPFQLDHCIWFHCVSLGETIAATPLIKKLIETYGPGKILITNTTPTGSEYVLKTFKTDIYHCYFPYDHPLVIRLFIRKLNPSILILMETELWPCLTHALFQRNIPMVLTNARLSEKSQKKYAMFSQGTKSMLNQLSIIAAQTEADAKRFCELGVDPQKVKVTGNLKYDAKIHPETLQKAETLRKNSWPERPVWIAGSTHEGEEEIIIAAHKKVLEAHPDALLILVPRHVDRCASVAQLIQNNGLTVEQRSKETTIHSGVQVYLGDTFGEMMLLYAASDIAFVGGSLIERGGHNLLEPAALKKPCLSGPHTFNFVQVTELLAHAGALLLVHQKEDLAQTVLTLMNDPAKRERMGARGLQVVEANRGALNKQFELIQENIK
jgi:3-deoxy-D-manno-octulosonic-acid transferase